MANSEAFGEMCTFGRYECWLFDDCSKLTRKRYVFCEYDNGVRLDVYFEEARKTRRHGFVPSKSWYRISSRRGTEINRPTDVPRFCIDRAVEHFRGLIQWVQ